MEETQVVIVGAGPSGLALALSLAKYEVHSVILEKTTNITEDPRGVYLTGDAVRICHDLGLGNDMDSIGHEVPTINFHKSTLTAKPFYTLDVSGDAHSQVVAGGILQIQPNLEKVLRAKIADSKFCLLRCGALVESQDQNEDHQIISYRKIDGSLEVIKCSWLVGADGKTGVVRKHFLEKSASIKQEENPCYQYEGTWVASNFKITLPTPNTHPDFPMWQLDMTPDDVYDLFWPKGWHFCNPPGKATASGRFGPHEDRYWRHEFEQSDWEETMDAEKMLWEHLTPMITRNRDAAGNLFLCGNVTFPRDCIEIRRCRPFRFNHKVVNKWFSKQTVLIGDAAHVFPPFGGQGIASGVRDAHQLAWRLAILVRLPAITKGVADEILRAWAAERRQGVDDAAFFTWINGTLCNYPEGWLFFLFRHFESFLAWFSFLPKIPDPQHYAERAGYKSVSTGCFLSNYNGGGRLAQVWLESSMGRHLLSDELLAHTQTIFSLMIIGDKAVDLIDAKKALSSAQIDPYIISEQSIVVISHQRQKRQEYYWIDTKAPETYWPMPQSRLSDELKIRPGYDDKVYLGRLGQSARFAIIRPDFYVFSVAKNVSELKGNLDCLKDRLCEATRD